MAEENYYELLQVGRDFTEQELKTSYRNLARKYHPDKNPNGLEEFKKIDKAYRVLLDKEKRRLYDERGNQFVWDDFQDDEREFTLDDLEAIIKSPIPNKKADPLKMDLQVELEDAYNGAVKHVQVSVIVPCSYCYGWFLRKKCTRCGGQKKETTKTVKVEIKKGVVNNQEINLIGEGNHEEDRLPGDLIFVIKIKSHRLYQSYGFNDMACYVYLSNFEARKGFTKTLPSLDGRLLNLHYMRGSIRDGSRMMVEGEGMPDYFDNNKKGRLFITFVVSDNDNLRNVSIGNYQETVGFVENVALIPLDDFENYAPTRRPLFLGIRRNTLALIVLAILFLIILFILLGIFAF